MLEHKDTEILGLRGLLAQAIKDGDRETALKLARRAYLRRPHTPWVLSTLFDLQTQAGLWSEALSTVGDMARHRVIDKATATRRRAILFHQEAAAIRAKGRPYAALEMMQKAHKRLPSLAPIAVQAAGLAAELNKPRQARKMLEASWRQEPHPEIARAYAGLDGKEQPADRLKQVERLHQLNPEHVASDLALAEHALAARQWSDRAHGARARHQEGPDGVRLAHAGRGRAGRGRRREGAHVPGQGGRCAARCGLALPEHRRGAGALVRVRAGWPVRQPAVGQAAQDRADAWRRARFGDPAAAGGEGRAALGAQAAGRRQAGDAAPPRPATPPRREASRGQVVRVDPKGAARPEPARPSPPEPSPRPRPARLTPPEPLASVRRRRSHRHPCRSSSAAEQLIRNQ